MAKVKLPPERRALVDRLREEASLTAGYAYDIVSGRRSPPLPKALLIFERTGLRFGPLRNATDKQVKTLVGLADAGEGRAA